MIKAYIVEFVNILNEMSPYLLLGFLIAGVLHVLMPYNKVVKYLGGKNLRSVVNASVLGVPLPLCSCGVIPTGLSFYKNGASKGSSVSFLISTPQTGVDSMMVTYSMLGLPLAILRPVIAFVTGILGGLLTNASTRKDLPEQGSNFNAAAQQPTYKNPVLEIMHYAFVEFLQDIAKWLVIGVLVAALISVLIPNDFFTAYLANDYISMLLVLAASVPLYVCATGSVPIAAVLLMKGLSPGAAIVFLMAGPATNVATITMVGKVLGKRALFSYLVSIIGGAIISGIIVNEFLPREWFLSGMNHGLVHNHEEMLPAWLQVSSSIILALLIINVFLLKYWKGKKGTVPTAMYTGTGLQTTTIEVKGMNCNKCKANVERNLSGLPGIKLVEVNLEKELVTISSENINLERIKDTVEGLGYTYGGPK